MRYIVAMFLLAHGLIHLGYLTPAPRTAANGPPWPFAMERAWPARVGVPLAALRVVGGLLVIALIVAFGAAALAASGFLVPADTWPVLTAGGAAISALTLALFFHRWLVIGLAIDVVLLYAVLVAGWQPMGSEV